MGAQQGPAQHLAGDRLEQVVGHDDVAQALAHLLAGHVEEAVVHPHPRELAAAVGADALGQLVLMVREDQVDAAAVDVDGQAELALDHRRAFDVPAGAPRTPGAVPHRLAGLRRLPEHEVGRMTLVGSDLDPRAGDHLVQRPARKLAVVAEALGVEQHMTFGGVGRATLDQGRDLGLHGLDVLGGLRLQRRAQRAERAHILVIGGQIPLGDDADVDALVGRLGVDLVVHVGDVARIDHRVGAIEVAQQTEQHVEHHHRPGVADMGVAVDRGAADIHRHPPLIARDEVALFAAHGVVKAKVHAA